MGALTHAGLKKGAFATLCDYTGEAKRLAEKHRIEILNETALANLLESIDASYEPEMLAILNDTTKYCPKCEGRDGSEESGERVDAGLAVRGGCSNYPRCRLTMPVP